MMQSIDNKSGSAPPSALLPPQEMAVATELVQRVLGQLDHTLLGRRQLHRMVLVGIFSRGHILLEGLPGVGKTALIKALGSDVASPVQSSAVHAGLDAQRHPRHAHSPRIARRRT